MSLNICCLKWGDKFSHDHVNKLYKMVCKRFHKDFTFICYTDNPDGIDSNVVTIPLPDYQLETWWWKLTLFQYAIKETTIFFDLDVVLQNDITHLVDYSESGKLCTIKAYWKPHRIDMEPKPPGFDMNLNSSVMIWKGDLTKIWDTFIEDPEKYMFTYKGIDSFLYFHHFEKLNWLPKGEVYSRLYGYDENNYQRAGKEEVKKYFYKEDYNICIFNGWRRKTETGNSNYLLDDDGYQGFEKYY